ncbi:hypothetical protein CEUSTIGMA_g13185.t1 [Chlamydomonas eustigma]|uniref:Uncharacterized protein n=1 Tax=Chlamydomonas eustigma TaxID=1157962 RepID=A0A250XSJ1_9CHLO|nr:hypothetical protein CEUSTIGMA_g13185.t1 [Chlamydomonas eustigma]|eukprot:GAX85770.1 hypothetical protein CEUSTIGMA_g13185.t1 [Chlamydomonas eustigma]
MCCGSPHLHKALDLSHSHGHHAQALDLSHSHGHHVQALDLSHSHGHRVQALDLSHNHIEEVPEAIRTLRELRVLNLARNWLNGSTLGRLSGLTQLQTLDISYVFSMNVFPVELCSLTDLTQLGLKCTYVHSFPEEVSRLSSLHSLDISFNSQLEHHEVSKILRPMQKLKALSLCHLDLQMFPEVLWTLTQLTLLELSRNRIRNISPDISLLTNLEALNLQGTFSCRHGTSLEALAPSLYCLTKLRILNLGCNFAGKMPAGISQLSRLQTLSLCMNGLLRLPPGIERLQMLSKLDIRQNQLRLPPAALFELKSLRRLAIHGNQLRPAALEQLEKHLVLQHCKIIQ